MRKIFYYIALCRPANVVTAMADVLGGISIAMLCCNILTVENMLLKIALLLGTTACLYSGGIVFNDVFDASLDRVERPERLIPSGIIHKLSAIKFGIILFIAAIACSIVVNKSSALITLSIITAALLYDFKSKHHSFLGPLNMGLCRGLNLMLGISLIPNVLPQRMYLCVVPLIYIFAVTTISRDEVYGGKKANLLTAFILYGIVSIAIIFTALLTKVYIGLLLLVPFWISTFRPLISAWQNSQPRNIIKAVKAGVISIIFLNAVWAAIHQQLIICIIILCLFPLSIWLSKYFAVT